MAAPSVNTGDSIRETTRTLGRWLRWIREHDEDLLHVRTVEDVHRAKREGKLGILFHFQNTLPFERDLDMLRVFHRLGVRVIQLTYNEQNFVGSGCEEANDTGLSRFGREAISVMNALGIVVDCAHTGLKTTMDAMEQSERPVVVSHGNARVVCDNDRNLPDDLLRAIADQGGLVGLVGFPAFVNVASTSPRSRPRGPLRPHLPTRGHSGAVGIGIDYYDGMSGVARDAVRARREYDERVAAESGILGTTLRHRTTTPRGWRTRASFAT